MTVNPQCSELNPYESLWNPSLKPRPRAPRNLANGRRGQRGQCGQARLRVIDRNYSWDSRFELNHVPITCVVPTHNSKNICKHNYFSNVIFFAWHLSRSKISDFSISIYVSWSVSRALGTQDGMDRRRGRGGSIWIVACKIGGLHYKSCTSPTIISSCPEIS